MVRSRQIVFLVAAVAMLSVPSARSQSWRGEGILQGTVSTTAGEPIVEAKVELRLESDPTTGPPPTRTNKRGEWRVLRLAPGLYELRIRARGFININGYAVAPSTGSSSPVEAQMLPLSWETPRFSSGSPNTLRLWLEKGNSLLEQGHPRQAREEYERALVQVPAHRQPEILQGIARTWYLEGEIGLAIASLEQALAIDPTDAPGRQLFALLMEQQGRGPEAETVLKELEDRGPVREDAASAEVLPRPPPIPEEIAERLAEPPDPPQRDRIGEFKISFHKRSGWSRIHEYARRIGVDEGEILAVDPAAGEYEPAEQSYQVIVPAAYRAGDGWGLLVWVSPTAFGGSRLAGMVEILSRHRLIWIGANRSGNERAAWDRSWLALDAAANMQELYDLDAERVYVAGYSGGGRIASQMAVLYPEVFRGVWALYGCDFYRSLPIVERPGTRYPASYAEPEPDRLAAVKQRSRFVLVTGTRDFNFTQTRSVAGAMEDEGFGQVTYLEIPDANHYTFPATDWLDRIFSALEPR